MSEGTSAGQGKLAQLIATRGGKAAPEAPFVIEHREALIYMLCEAAELEHGIMCQYLFAAFSLKQREDEGLTAAELEVVTRWRKQISHVATQEMLHLALVHNIMSAIGGAPHLARVNLPAQANHYPAGVQLALLPFGEPALKHFMFLERPETYDLEDAPGMAAIGRAEPVMATHDIVPRLQDFATVGHLYRSIEAGLSHLCEKFGEKWLFIGPPRAQATSANFHWPELIPVTDLASACRAVGEILEQGEGPRGHWQNAHFGQFVAILDEYQQMRAANPSFDPVRPVLAANVRPIEHADVPLITDALTARCMDLFNVGYEILLLAFERYFAHTEETGEQLETLAELTLGLMFNVLKPLGDLITSLPAGPEYPGRTAAPSFELFYESDYLVPHRAAAWAMLEERLREAASFAERVRTRYRPAWEQTLVPVGESLVTLADSLAAHFPEWGVTSRWATPAIDDVTGFTPRLARAAELLDGPAPALAADVRAIAQDRAAMTAARLAELAVTTARLRADHPDPALMEASATLQDIALRLAPAENMTALLDSLRTAQAGVEPGIVVATDGPYLVTNAEHLRNWLGEDLPARPQMALCRCGGSAIKPFCDGTHATNGFSGAKDPKRVPDRRDLHPGQSVTVFDNRGICQHSGFCTDRLSAVFHASGDPFVTPAAGRADDIIAAVRACPSGALSFAVDDVEQRPATDHHGTREPAIEVSKDGPYRITGGLPLTEPDGKDVPRAEGSSREHYALCRCGQSQNKPFCSGMHWYVGFADPAASLPRPEAQANSARPTLFEWAGGFPALLALARTFYEKYLPSDPVLAPLGEGLAPGQAQRAADRMALAFGGPSAPVGQAVRSIKEDQRARWVSGWLSSADEVKLPAEPEFRSAFTAYVAWEAAAPADAEIPRWDWGPAGAPAPSTTAADAGPTEGEPELPGPDEPVSFARHIKPLFREKDRKSMSFVFDLWSYADVSAHADGILDRLRNGTMPCDGAWPADRVAVFQRWTESGQAE
ncbi:MAG: CDGSH iron-sulfur domain-containing protein [Streptosporangiaceae bacterium]|nr:CDGSH iron-sulfur domain-containing protein [Streptosporangiaceae bacterium]